MRVSVTRIRPAPPFARLVALAAATLLSSCSHVVEPPDRVSLSFATINLLHGLFCEQEHCRLEDRVDLLMDWIEERGCPDAVTLQEVWSPTMELLGPRLGEPCGFEYALIVGREQTGVDDEVLLSRYPVGEVELVMLEGGFRHVLITQLDHPWGPVELYSTHLASGADGGPDPCDDCPDVCVDAGAVTLRDCQAVQMAELARERGGALAVIAGDLNDPPGSFLYDRYTDAGWVDVYLDAGNPECDPSTGSGCTSGREDETLEHLEDPATHTDERIDFLFLSGTDRDLCVVDGPDDTDGDGIATRLFADEPSDVDCGPSPSPICWPSDHVGVQLDLDCWPIHGDEPYIPPEFIP